MATKFADKCEYIILNTSHASLKKFVANVLAQHIRCPGCYPTSPQEHRIHTIWLSYVNKAEKPKNVKLDEFADIFG